MQAPDSTEQSLRSARELLGVAPDATAAQLARAYRRQARRLHPDTSLEPDATEQFWTLQAAYQVALDAARNGPPAAEAPARVEHRGTTVVLGEPSRGAVGWLAAGPVRVRPPRRPGPGSRSTSSGARP